MLDTASFKLVGDSQTRRLTDHSLKSGTELVPAQPQLVMIFSDYKLVLTWSYKPSWN